MTEEKRELGHLPVSVGISLGSLPSLLFSFHCYLREYQYLVG